METRGESLRRGKKRRVCFNIKNTGLASIQRQPKNSISTQNMDAMQNHCHDASMFMMVGRASLYSCQNVFGCCRALLVTDYTERRHSGLQHQLCRKHYRNQTVITISVHPKQALMENTFLNIKTLLKIEMFLKTAIEEPFFV